VDLGADSILVGTHAWLLPPLEAAEVVDVVRRDLRAKLPLPVERLRAVGAVLVIAGRWQKAVFERNERLLEPPKLRNSSGDPIRLVTDRYRFIESTRGAVETALASIKDASEVERQADGTSVVAFQKGDTVTGTAFVGGGELRLETNSRRRAAALRRKVENACRGLLTGHQRSEGDPWDALDDAEDVEANEDALPADEVKLIREEKARHYATWPDTPPAVSRQQDAAPGGALAARARRARAAAEADGEPRGAPGGGHALRCGNPAAGARDRGVSNMRITLTIERAPRARSEGDRSPLREAVRAGRQ